MKHPYYGVENTILGSLYHDPNDWIINEFEAKNPKINISIWISNGRWALKVYLGGDRHTGTKISPGKDVVVWSLARWRYRLWSAIEDTKRAHLVSAIKRQMVYQKKNTAITNGAEEYDEIMKQQEIHGSDRSPARGP